MPKTPPKPLCAHIIFSSNAYRENPKQYKNFLAILEKRCRVKIVDRWFEEKKPLRPQEIYLRSLRAIRNADIIIAEATVNSTGMGQQIAYSLTQRKPVIICIANTKNNRHHAFLEGTTSELLRKIYYRNNEELTKNLLKELVMRNDIRPEKFNFIATRYAKQKLNEESTNRGISQSQLLRQIIEDWIRNHS